MLDDHSDVDTCHRANVAHRVAVGPQDLDLLQACGDRRRHLNHPFVQPARERVDLAQRFDLHRKPRARNGVAVGVKALVSRARCIRPGATARADREPRGLGRAFESSLADVGGVRIAGHLTADRPQSEAFRGIVAGRLEPAVVEHKRFRAPPFKEQLAVVRTIRRIAHDLQRSVAIQCVVKWREGCVGHCMAP